MKLKPIHKKLGLLTILALMGLAMPTYFAHADGFLGIGSFASGAVSDFVFFFLSTIFRIIGTLVAVLASALNWATFTRAGGNIPIVATTWKILRDFSNMIFIILLIYAAFATIFNQQNYSFQKIIGRFIIVAVLINFSLVIGNIVIDFCQVLSNLFLGSIGNLGDRLGQYLTPLALLPSSLKATDLGGAAVASLVFAIILALILLFSFIVATTFAIIRLPIIWALLLVSPLAWMANILPSTQGWWKKWWGQFIGWNLYLPVWLFFMYLGLLFLSKRDEVINAVIKVNAASGAAAPNHALLGGLTYTLTFNLVFFYIFAGFVIVGATWAAIKVTGFLGGEGFGKGVGWATEFAHNIKGFTQLRPMRDAAQARWDQVRKEGAPGPLGAVWRGQAGYDKDRAKWSERFGVKDAQFQNAKSQVAGVEKEVSRLRDQERAGQIQINEDFKIAAAKESNMSAKGLAMRSLLYERGMIDEPEFRKDLETWTRTNPFLAESMIKKAQKGGFKSLKADNLLQAAAAEGEYSFLGEASGSAARKDFYNALIGDKDIKGLDSALSKMTPAQLKQAVDLNGGDGTNESIKFKKAIGKKRPDLVAQYEAGRKGTLRSQYFKLLKTTSAKDIAEALPVAWRDPAFQEALRFKIRYHATAKPALPPGRTVAATAFPGGPPPGTFRTPDGRILIPNGAGIPLPAGVPNRAFKGKASGGDDFRASLDKATLDNAAKNKIVTRL